MFKVYTGYFAQLKKYQAKDLFTVSISQYPPRWAKVDYKEKALAPSPALLSGYKEGKFNVDEYITKYIRDLKDNDIVVDGVLTRLHKEAVKAGKKGMVLLCFEKPTDFCHRFIVSLESKLDIPEFGVAKTYLTSNRSRMKKISVLANRPKIVKIVNGVRVDVVEQERVTYMSNDTMSFDNVLASHTDTIIIPVTTDGNDKYVRLLDKRFKGILNMYRKVCEYGIARRARGVRSAREAELNTNVIQLKVGSLKRVKVNRDTKDKRNLEFIFVPIDNGKTSDLKYWLLGMDTLLNKQNALVITDMTVILPKFKGVTDKHVLSKTIDILSKTKTTKTKIITLKP